LEAVEAVPPEARVVPETVEMLVEAEEEEVETWLRGPWF